MVTSWAKTKIEEIAEINPRVPKAALSVVTPVSFVPMAAVGAGDGSINVSDIRPYSAVQKGYTPFQEGDVLFAKITPCMENGKMAVVPKVENGYGFGSTEFHVLRPYECIETGYLYYFVSSKQFRMDAEHNMSGAVGQRRVPTSYLAACEIPLPPLPEQKRIVAKIEELLSELDKGIESFKTAREQLKVYRQALLKHAFEGKLTAAWREENNDKLETADALLKQIQAERAERYRQQVKEWEKATKEWEKCGKQGSKPVKPSMPKELPPLTAEELLELPQFPYGWGLARIGDISDCLDSVRVPINKAERSRRHGEVPYYGANGQVGWIDDFLFDEPLILVVEDETFTGRERPFSYKIEGKSWVNNHAHILKTLPRIEIDFLNYQLFYYPLTKRTTGTTGRKKLTQEALITAPVNICSTCEQKEIVAQLEAKISALDNLDQTIATALQQSEALRQSILKKAFSGQLVPQASNDEPAAELLARIKAERAVAKPNTKGGRVADSTSKKTRRTKATS
jgi:type I restriction enzyme S subunit